MHASVMVSIIARWSISCWSFHLSIADHVTNDNTGNMDGRIVFTMQINYSELSGLKLTERALNGGKAIWGSFLADPYNKKVTIARPKRKATTNQFKLCPYD